MQKFIRVLCAVALLFCLCFSVNAANSISSAQTSASVFSDGSCQVNMTLTIHLEETVDRLYFPVPGNATGISLNGSRVSAPRSGDVRNVNLSRLLRKITGDLSFSIQYSLRDVIHTNEAGIQELQLPLLSGFEYSITSMEFTVTLPGNVEGKPAFSSGYHNASIEADLNCTVDRMTITGNTLKPLKDHETLVMTLPVSDEMFPRSIVETYDPSAMAIAMGICAGLMLLYWLIALRYFPLFPEETTEPPEGYDAGSMGSVLSLQGIDLSMTVLTWAQLGYLSISIARKGHIQLNKRMEMGNERSAAEQWAFKKLFAKSSSVDTASLHFAHLWYAVGKKRAPIRELVHPRSGNLTVLRGLGAGIGLFGGAGIGLVMGNGAALQALFVILMAAAGALSGWWILLWGSGIGLRHKTPMYTGFALGVLWLILGISCGEFIFSLWMVAGLLFAGLLLRFGGLRTDLGKQTAARVAGLRSYLRKQDSAQLQQRCEADPDYFFRMLPYAIALGVEKQFAKAFKKISLGECPYITGGPGEGMRATVWCQTFLRTVRDMEGRAKQLPMERFWKLIDSLRNR